MPFIKGGGESQRLYFCSYECKQNYRKEQKETLLGDLLDEGLAYLTASETDEED